MKKNLELIFACTFATIVFIGLISVLVKVFIDLFNFISDITLRGGFFAGAFFCVVFLIALGFRYTDNIFNKYLP